MKAIVIEQDIRLGQIESKDGGMVIELSVNPNDDMAISLSSFDEDGRHKEISELLGKTVRITIEVVD